MWPTGTTAGNCTQLAFHCGSSQCVFQSWLSHVRHKRHSQLPSTHLLAIYLGCQWLVLMHYYIIAYKTGVYPTRMEDRGCLYGDVCSLQESTPKSIQSGARPMHNMYVNPCHLSIICHSHISLFSSIQAANLT